MPKAKPPTTERKPLDAEEQRREQEWDAGVSERQPAMHVGAEEHEVPLTDRPHAELEEPLQLAGGRAQTDERRKAQHPHAGHDRGEQRAGPERQSPMFADAPGEKQTQHQQGSDPPRQVTGVDALHRGAGIEDA